MIRRLMPGLLILLVGCGVGSSPLGSKAGALRVAATSLFPTQVGYTWQYDAVAHPTMDPDHDVHGKETMRIESRRQEGAATVLSVRGHDDFTTRTRFFEIRQDDRRLVLQGVTYWGTAAQEAEGLTIDWLRFPLQPGAKWDDGLWVGEIKVKEKVTVKAGTYEAWKVGAIGTYQQQYTAVGTYWLAPGVGVVKSDLYLEGWNVESELATAGVSPAP